jgi:hypothetical protein
MITFKSLKPTVEAKPFTLFLTVSTLFSSDAFMIMWSQSIELTISFANVVLPVPAFPKNKR